MAVLTKMPNEAIISTFKGVIDFYLWKGIPCCRKWPRWQRRQPYPEEKANQDAFAYINKAYINLPTYIKDQWTHMAEGTPLTAKDLFVRAYMSGIDY